MEDPEAVAGVLRAAALCCDARLLPPARGGEWRVLGDTTEGAILVAAAKACLDLAAEAASTPRVGVFPFDPGRKLMSTIHRVGGGFEAYVTGSPQAVLARCRYACWQGQQVPLTEDLRRAAADANDAMAGQGLRVLAVASKPVGSARVVQDEAAQQLMLLGLVGMSDPPRPEVTGAVTACHRAGITIYMVTGDYGLTAEAIARRIGIIGDGPLRMIAGADLDAASDDELAALLRAHGQLIFARVRLREHPPVPGVSVQPQPGRARPILAASFLGFPQVPLTALQVLAIDLGSDVMPALALGAERPEPGTMDRPPRPPRERLFSWPVVRRFLFLGDIQSAGVVFAFFWRIHTAHLPFDAYTTASLAHNATADATYREALTMTQAGIVVSQFFNSFTVRTGHQSVFRVGLLSNPPLVAAGIFGLSFMAAISYLPALQSVFSTAPLRPPDWLLLVGLGALLLVADEARKAWHRRADRRSARRQPGRAPAASGMSRKEG